MNENRIWYVNVNTQTYGPYSREEIISMLKTETIKYSDYIFKEGFKNWDYIYNVNDFDRRLLNPGGDQPLVHAPKEAAPQEAVQQEKVQEGEKPVDELWYIHDGEHQVGPYSASYIKEALENKTLFWTYYVWKEGFDNWVQVKDCKEFDRRKTPRGQTPSNIGVTTDYDEIQKGAVSGLPKKEDNPQIYGAVEQPSSFQYGISDLDQEELKGKYPVKGVLILIGVMAVLFGVVRAYPWLSERSREKRAMEMYEAGIQLIDRQDKPEDGFTKLFDLMDMYPNSAAERKNENYIRSKEPMVKSQLAEEGRKIRRLVEDFDKKYGILPANAVDIGYVPSFWLKYFGEVYFKRNTQRKIEVMVKGLKFPVETYAFTTDTDNKENEQDLKPEDTAASTRLYTKLSYTGKKSMVRPLELPKILKTTVLAPEKQPEAKEPAIKEPPVVKRKETPTTVKKAVKKPLVTDDRVPTSYDEQEYTDDEQQTSVQDENAQATDETDEPDTTTDEYEDAINSIRKER